MKKLSRRALLRGAGAGVVGGAALAAGLSPATKTILAGSRVGRGWVADWSPETHVPSNVTRVGETNPAISRLWSETVMEEIRKATLMRGALESEE
jgi:hypothetical protein